MKNILNFRRLFWLIAFLALALNQPIAFASLKTLDEAVHIAGKQRTLTVQMLKNYGLMTMKVRVRKAQQELAEEVSLFDTQLAELKNFSKEAKVQQQITAIGQLWQETKAVYAVAPTNTSQLQSLNGKIEKLLDAHEHLTVLLLKNRTDDRAGLLNFANSQQMLVERIVVLYILKSAGITTPYQTAYSKTVDEFGQNLAFLSNYVNNTIKIRTQLERVKKHFNRFNTTVMTGKGSYTIAIAAASAEKMSEEMDNIIAGYQKLKMN
jgi:phage shock protein A